MSTKAISQLDQLDNPTDYDILPVVSDGSNYKITKAQFLGSSNNFTQYDSAFNNSHAVVFGRDNTTYGTYTVNVGHSNDSYYGDSVVVGGENTSIAPFTFAFGKRNLTSTPAAVALGWQQTSSGYSSVAIGGENHATGNLSVAIGYENWATSYCSTSIGNDNLTYSQYATAIGDRNTAGYCSIAIGSRNSTNGSYGVTAGYKNFGTGNNTFVIGSNNASYYERTLIFGTQNSITERGSAAIGNNNSCSGYASFAFGSQNTTSGTYSVAAGYNNFSTGYSATTFGSYNWATGYASVAIGNNNSAYDQRSVVIGLSNTTGYEQQNTAIGYDNQATAYCATAIGQHCWTNSDYSVVAGYYATTYGTNTVVIGQQVCAHDSNAVVIGNNAYGGNHSVAIGGNVFAGGEDCTVVIGSWSHCPVAYAVAIGCENTSSGHYSISAGYDNTASGYCSVSIGTNNTASSSYTVAIGNNNNVSYNYTMALGSNSSTFAAYTNAIGYHANARIEATTNISGGIIVQKSTGFVGSNSSHEPYAGVETILMSEVIDLTTSAYYYSYPHAFAFKELPTTSWFYPDEIGFIVTTASDTSVQPTIQCGTEVGKYIQSQRIQMVSASGSGTSIQVTWSQPTVNGNALILVCAAEGLADTPDITTTIQIGGSSYTSADRHSLHTENGITVATFILENAVACNGFVQFNFNSIATAAVGFIMEYNGVSRNGDAYYSTQISSGTGTNILTTDFYANTTNLNPGSLTIATIVNNQIDNLHDAINGYTIIGQLTVGGSQCAILERIVIGTGLTQTGITSDGNVPYFTIVNAYQVAIAGSNDLVDPVQLETNVLSAGKRIRFTDLKNTDGHNFLWAGVTVPAEMSEGGTVQGRFYWKGIFVEKQ